jgi:hypothetical protein
MIGNTIMMNDRQHNNDECFRFKLTKPIGCFLNNNNLIMIY